MENGTQATEIAHMSDVCSGIDLFWNWNWSKAEEIFAAKASMEMAGWMPLSYLASVAWARAVVTESPQDSAAAFQKLDKARDAVRKVRSAKLPNPKETPLMQSYVLAGKLIYARMLMYDAFLKLKMDSRIKGAYNFRKSWKYFAASMRYLEALSPSAPSYSDLAAGVEYGYGMFLFMVSVVPREWLWLVEVIGFEGNRAKGLANLNKAADSNSYFAIEATFNLIWLSTFMMDDRDAGIAYAKRLLEKFPHAAHVKYMLGYVHRRHGEVDIAHKLFQSAREDAQDCSPIFQLYCDYEIGYDQFLNLEWPLALESLQKFYDVNTVVGFKAYSAYMLAMCYEMQFQPEKAAPLMKKLQDNIRKTYDYDEYADRHAKRYLARGFTLFERKLFMAALHIEAARSDDALDALDGASSQAETAEDKAAVASLRGSAYLKKKDHAQATIYFEEALSGEKAVKTETWIVPLALVGLAEIALEANRIEEAEKLFKKGKSHSGYDFSQLLQWRIMLGLDRIALSKSKGKAT